MQSKFVVNGSTRLTKVAIWALCLAVLPAPASAALILPDATFTEEYLIYNSEGNLAGAGFSDAVPESISGDGSVGGGEQAVVAINVTGGPAPMVDIQSSVSGPPGSFGTVQANGVINYFFGVVSKANPNQVGGAQVALNVMVLGSINILAPSGEFVDEFGAVVRGNISSYVGVAGAMIGFDQIEIGTFSGCGGGRRAGCSTQQSIDPIVSSTVLVDVGGIGGNGYVRAEVRNDGGNGETYEVQALADPIISFADPDDALLYDIVFSSNLLTTVPVPLPPSVLLVGLGLAGLGFATRRREARRST